MHAGMNIRGCFLHAHEYVCTWGAEERMCVEALAFILEHCLTQ